jgi:hypothetical protein
MLFEIIILAIAAIGWVGYKWLMPWFKESNGKPDSSDEIGCKSDETQRPDEIVETQVVITKLDWLAIPYYTDISSKDDMGITIFKEFGNTCEWKREKEEFSMYTRIRYTYWFQTEFVNNIHSFLNISLVKESIQETDEKDYIMVQSRSKKPGYNVKFRWLVDTDVVNSRVERGSIISTPYFEAKSVEEILKKYIDFMEEHYCQESYAQMITRVELSILLFHKKGRAKYKHLVGIL